MDVKKKEKYLVYISLMFDEVQISYRKWHFEMLVLLWVVYHIWKSKKKKKTVTILSQHYSLWCTKRKLIFISTAMVQFVYLRKSKLCFFFKRDILLRLPSFVLSFCLLETMMNDFQRYCSEIKWRTKTKILCSQLLFMNETTSIS